jgi:hypothetical protein
MPGRREGATGERGVVNAGEPAGWNYGKPRRAFLVRLDVEQRGSNYSSRNGIRSLEVKAVEMESSDIKDDLLAVVSRLRDEDQRRVLDFARSRGGSSKR